MADIEELQNFAVEHGFGLTAPLTHSQVVRLAEYWLPRMCFHWDERFHPITLDDVFAMASEHFSALPVAERDAWRIWKFVRIGPTAGGYRAFDPPVVHVPDGTLPEEQEEEPAPGMPHPSRRWPTVRVIGEGAAARNALWLPEVDTDAMVTHGANFDRSSKFFGPLRTLLENEDEHPPAAGNPFLPRADEPAPNGRRPRITVMAAFLNLFELLKYELTVARETEKPEYDYPPDGLRHGFDILSSLLYQTQAPTQPETGWQREYLLSVIAAYEANDPLPSPPVGWVLDRAAWNAVTRYAFLEYYFFYAYNDFERYQTALFDNEHEGDDEGCCLVFDRNVLNAVATSGQGSALLRALPHSIITSVHEEYQDADLFKLIPTPFPPPADPDWRARDSVNFTVYIAGGSHATYLTPGDHDLVDFQDYWGYVDEIDNSIVHLIGLVLVIPIGIILSIIEHFVDTEDFTSDEGVHAGSDDIVGDHPAKVAAYVQVLPMSANNHIYMRRNEALLLLRAFAGKWGGHDDIVDKSPPFAPKTGRYFRKLVSNLG